MNTTNFKINLYINFFNIILSLKMNERMVIKTAKSLNREKYILDKLNKQIENLQEKEQKLKNEYKEVTKIYKIQKLRKKK